MQKKVDSRVQTQMTNTKCRIDCAKYNVKWNFEFWRKWNAIVSTLPNSIRTGLTEKTEIRHGTD